MVRTQISMNIDIRAVDLLIVQSILKNILPLHLFNALKNAITRFLELALCIFTFFLGFLHSSDIGRVNFSMFAAWFMRRRLQDIIFY